MRYPYVCEYIMSLYPVWKRAKSDSTSIRILNYHGVVDRKKDMRLTRNFHLVDDFRDHVRFLKRCHVLSLEELAETRPGMGPNTRAKVVITFDDGYANNLTAAEILSEVKMPWTVAVCTGEVGRGQSIWTVELSLLLLQGNAARLELWNTRFSLENRVQREMCFQVVRKKLKYLSASEKNRTIEEIRGQFPKGETERLLQEFPEFKLLSWDAIRQLSNAGVYVASHGTVHELHHRNQPAEVRRRELVESKQRLETKLEKQCQCFCFPNGDYVETSPDELRQAGYRLGVTTRSGCFVQGTNPYLVPRIQPKARLSRFIRDLR